MINDGCPDATMLRAQIKARIRDEEARAIALSQQVQQQQADQKVLGARGVQFTGAPGIALLDQELDARRGAAQALTAALRAARWQLFWLWVRVIFAWPSVALRWIIRKLIHLFDGQDRQ